ncbi:WD40 repeat-like protein [Fistulina hepatica ATCC 64428]|nr:WD40 repeat-like protein [Fistulina hepatica ATCC 64428]
MSFVLSQSSSGSTPSAAVMSNWSCEKDMEVPNPPPDSISSLAFSPQSNYLAAGSWDNSVRIYEVAANGQTQGKAMYNHDAPVLGVCWSKDGTKVFSGGADNAARVFDATTGQAAQIAQHQAPIKSVRWIDGANVLVTGSWDKSIKYWDLRSATPAMSVTLSDRCYSLDTNSPMVVVATADRKIHIYDLNNAGVPFKTRLSPLQFQTRVVACWPGAANGYALGSISGRIAIEYFEDTQPSKSYSFRCHRRDTASPKEQLVYAVNDIAFNPAHGTFATCGGDGTITFWDKDSRLRLRSYDPCPGPVSTVAFNHLGNIAAYAISYDWSKGYKGMTPSQPNRIMLHACQDEEVRRRQK